MNSSISNILLKALIKKFIIISAVVVCFIALFKNDLLRKAYILFCFKHLSLRTFISLNTNGINKHKV